MEAELDTVCIEYFTQGKLVAKTMFSRQGGVEIRNKYYFDTSGRKISQDFIAVGLDSSRTDFIHDSYGNLTKSKTYALGKGSDTVNVICLNKLNSDSLSIQTDFYYQGKLQQTIYFSYNNKLLSEVRILKMTNDSSILQQIEVYSYDTAGSKISYVVKKPDGSLSRKELYSYNKAKNLIEEKDYLGNDSLINEMQFFYLDEKKDYAIIKTPSKHCKIKFVCIEL